jgi:NarL family two-component system response regulator LiaR
MNEPPLIRILIVDDHAMVRSGLKQFLMVYDDFELVGAAGSGAEAIELCRLHQPDVILMDLVLPDMDGAQATQTILAEAPETKVVALTSFPEQDLIEQALKAGAISYLMKNISAEELAQAIRTTYAGRSTLTPEAMQALLQSKEEKSNPGGDLTKREREVLDLIVQGLSNPEIAGRLHITLATVKFHVSVIYSKLGASNRADAVSLTWQHNLLDKS